MNSGLQIEIRRRIKLFLCVVPCGLLALLLCGCATSRVARTPAAVSAHQFNFQTDTLAYANELTWDYSFNTNGQWTAHKRTPKPEYTLHCFAVVHAASQFFSHARFDPSQPPAGAKTYGRLIRQVMSAGSSSPQVVVPGYTNLHEFSGANEALLKSESGGAWRSYLQRGNWRMVFPFSRKHQQRTANLLLDALDQNRLPVVHIVRFPNGSLNHGLLIFGAEQSDTEIRFKAYDPNDPGKPATLTYDKSARAFSFPATSYFVGGPVNAYRIFHKWNY